MIIDAHNHIGEKKGLSFSAEELINRMDEANINKAIVFSFPEQIDNNYIADSVKKYSKRLIGFATINPWLTNAEDELKYAVEILGLKGLKLHPVKHGYSFDNHTILDPIFKMCSEYNLPIIAYGGANILSSPNMFEEMAKTFPDVNILLAHGGQMYETRSAIEVAKRQPNVYIETSSMFARRITSLLNEQMLEKIIFGTDSPYGDFRLEVEKIKLVEPNEEKQKLIFYKTIEMILNKGGGNNDY